MEHGPSARLDQGSAFPQTHWTTIFNTGSTDPEQARAALGKLCDRYRQPIVNWFFRHAEKQDAEDLCHTFIEYLLTNEVLSQLEEKKGRFRYFLVTVMRRFLYRSWTKAAAQKRGSNFSMVSLADDETVAADETGTDSQFDMDLALDIHGRVMKRIQPPPELLSYIFGKDSGTGWDEIAARLKTTPTALRQKVRRIRRSHWEGFRDEVAEMVSGADKADETQYLYELLFKNLPAET